MPHFLDARFLYDEDHGPLKGVGGFVELVYRSSFYLDNANLLQAPGYEIVNAGLHYDPPVEAGPLHKAHIYFEVENLLNKTYVGSASNITDTLGANGQSAMPRHWPHIPDRSLRAIHVAFTAASDSRFERAPGALRRVAFR